MYPIVFSLGGTEVLGATDGRHVCLAVAAWATLGTLTPATHGAPPALADILDFGELPGRSHLPLRSRG